MSSDFRLGDIAEIVMGQSPTGDCCNQDGKGKPLLNGPTEFGPKHPFPVQFTTDPKKFAEPSDLLFCVRGSTTGRMNWADQQYAIGRGIAAIRGRDRYPNSFIRAVIETNLDSLLVQATGSTFPNVSRDLLNGLPVPVLNETDAIFISEIIEPLDDRITLLRETNATLEAIAQALFKSWFVDFDPVRAKMESRAPEGMSDATAALFLDSFEESELGLVPKGWQMGTLADFATYLNGYAFKTKDWQEAGHPVVKIGNVKPGLIDVSGASCVSPKTVVGLERFKLNRGDLLVGMTGYVGETGLVPSIDPPAFLNQRVGKISTKCGMTDLGFVYCLVRNPAYKAHAELKSHGSAQANVSSTDLMAYPCVLPEARVLDAFNEILCPMIEGILESHDKAQTLATLRDTLLPRLISGQLRLPDIEEHINSLN